MRPVVRAFSNMNVASLSVMPLCNSRVGRIVGSSRPKGLLQHSCCFADLQRAVFVELPLLSEPVVTQS